MSPSGFLDEAIPAAAPPEARWVWAVVTQSSPLRIRLDGDRVALGITPDDMGSIPRPVGQRVYCQILQRRLVVMGPDVPVEPPPAYAGAISIPAGVNLNTYVTPGRYSQGTIANATYALNYPIEISGLLTVDATATRVWQRYFTAGATQREFIRYLAVDGTVQPWREVTETKKRSEVTSPTTGNADANERLIPGSAVTLATEPGREYRLDVICHVQSTTAGDRLRVTVRRGSVTGTVVGAGTVMPGWSGVGQVLNFSCWDTPGAGDTTWVLTFQRAGGTGTALVTASSVSPIVLAVYAE